MEKINFDDYIQIEILKILMGTPFPLTSHALGKSLKVSSQNIRKHIHQINATLRNYDLSVKSKPGMGYVYESCNSEHDKHLRSSIFDSLIYDKRITQDKYVREHLIIRHLIMSEGVVTPNELADTFYISRSTLFRDLDRAKDTMGNTYNIKLIVEPYQGIHIKGTEVSLRMLLGREFSFYNDDNLLYVLCDLLLVEPIEPKDFNTFIRKSMNVSVSSNRLYSLYIHFYIMLARSQQGHTIQEYDIKIPCSFNDGGRECMQDFIHTHHPDLKIPELEITYYLLLIQGISRNNHLTLDIDTKLQEAINQSLNRVSKQYRVSLEDLKSNPVFYAEIESLMIRSENHFISSNFNDKIIKQKSPFCIELAYQFLRELRDVMPLRVIDMDYYSVAMLLYNYVDLDTMYQRRQVMVYSGYSVENSRKLIASLACRFPMLEFEYVNDAWESIQTDHYEFLLSDRYVNFDWLDKPQIKIQHFISKADYIKLDQIYERFLEEKYGEIRPQVITKKISKRKTVLHEILKQYEKTVQDKVYKRWVCRDDELTLEIRNGVAVLWTSVDAQVASSVYHLQHPVFWRYAEVSKIFVINVQNLNGLMFNEWERLIRNAIDTV